MVLKRFLAASLSALLIFNMTACNSNKNNDSDYNSRTLAHNVKPAIGISTEEAIDEYIKLYSNIDFSATSSDSISLEYKSEGAIAKETTLNVMKLSQDADSNITYVEGSSVSTYGESGNNGETLTTLIKQYVKKENNGPNTCMTWNFTTNAWESSTSITIDTPPDRQKLIDNTTLSEDVSSYIATVKCDAYYMGMDARASFLKGLDTNEHVVCNATLVIKINKKTKQCSEFVLTMDVNDINKHLSTEVQYNSIISAMKDISFGSVELTMPEE
ncbi:MAG: hypothetical protein IKL73_07270 [Lachnospiraceae bacterium]|nr:hypothetical protein [Lachnospiraceae bacterium]